jgi:hypothetical protein
MNIVARVDPGLDPGDTPDSCNYYAPPRVSPSGLSPGYNLCNRWKVESDPPYGAIEAPAMRFRANAWATKPQAFISSMKSCR